MLLEHMDLQGKETKQNITYLCFHCRNLDSPSNPSAYDKNVESYGNVREYLSISITKYFLYNLERIRAIDLVVVQSTPDAANL